jgi:hypothetical protein
MHCTLIAPPHTNGACRPDADCVYSFDAQEMLLREKRADRLSPPNVSVNVDSDSEPDFMRDKFDELLALPDDAAVEDHRAMFTELQWDVLCHFRQVVSGSLTGVAAAKRLSSAEFDLVLAIEQFYGPQ